MKTIAKIREHRAALVAAHQASTTPAETVAALVAQIGQESAAYIIASMINAKGDWDGRVSSTVRAWAAADEIPTRQQLDDACVWYCDEIHPAHMDQIARAMMEYKPEPEPEPAEETATTFPHILAAVLAEAEQKKENTAHYIARGWWPTWAEEHRADPLRGIREHATAHTWEQLQRGEISAQTAAERALKRALKAIDKDTAEKAAKLARVAQADTLGMCDIWVEWKRNACWGNNPTATATAYNERGNVTGETSGRASGCGYDKRSAAVADALNDSDSALKVLYTAEESALREGRTNRREAIGYGLGYGVLPYFEGGVGVGCFWRFFQAQGYRVNANESGKHADFYMIVKEA